MNNKKPSVFIAGSTKGTHQTVSKRFQTVANELKEKGYSKVQMPTVVAVPEATWDDSIKSDITHLMGVDELYMLSNWQGHKRSEILRDIARKIGIKITYQ